MEADGDHAGQTGMTTIGAEAKGLESMKARTVLSGLLLCSVSVMGIVGCVPMSQYDDATAANNRAQAELKDCLSRLQESNERNNQLANDLAAMQSAMTAKDEVVSNLEAANRAWETRFNELAAKYDALAGRDIGPPPLGEVLLPPELDRQLMQWAEQHPDMVEYDRPRGMVKFKTDLLFAKGSDDVSNEAARTLTALSSILKGAEGAQFHVYVAGHTDDIPIEKPETKRRHPNNWYLSVHRAVSVVDALASSGVKPGRMAAMGFGEYHPIVPNEPGNKGNAANRRVEIWIVGPDRFLTTPTGQPGGSTTEPQPAKP